MARVSDAGVRDWWRRLIEGVDGQSDSVADYCRRHGVSTASFYRWRRRLLADKADGAGPSSSPRLLTVKASDSQPRQEGRSPAAIVFPGGVRLELPVDDGSWLGEAIHALAAETLARVGEEVRS